MFKSLCNFIEVKFKQGVLQIHLQLCVCVCACVRVCVGVCVVGWEAKLFSTSELCLELGMACFLFNHF